MCRSVAISDALNLQAVKAEALEATLDGLASGVYLTDREDRIVYMNRAAERQVKTSNALWMVNNRQCPMRDSRIAFMAASIGVATPRSKNSDLPRTFQQAVWHRAIFAVETSGNNWGEGPSCQLGTLWSWALPGGSEYD